MRSFFVQIFLAFWISTLVTFAVTTMVFPNRNHPPPENVQAALRSSVDQLARLLIEHSPAVCDGKAVNSFFVLDERSVDVCGRTVRSAVRQLAEDVRRSGHREFSKIDSYWAAGLPVSARGPGTYTAVVLTPYPGRTWFPHLPPSALPVSALVTFVFAYFLTNPVRALRAAFRRFAAGDMTVRLPVSRSALGNWGGSDIRTLMIDFNDMADRIQALLEAHKTLLRDVSHELRSPLARMNVALELAREEAGQATAALDRAELESSRLNSLIGELLSLSLMETIQEVPNRKLVFLSDMVEDSMPDLLFEADARGCQVNHVRQDSCPVLGSEELLRRAIENIVRNAIRYSPAGGEVSIATKQESGKSILQVCDSGPGVPEESLQAIFRPFYRVDSARQTTTGGFGVGLAIAQRAVQINGGTIRAFNRQAGGLCVELCLPCAGSGSVNGTRAS